MGATQEIKAGYKLKSSNPLSPYMHSNDSKGKMGETFEGSAYDINIPDIKNLQDEPQGSKTSSISQNAVGINIIDWPNAHKNMITKKYVKPSETVAY